MKKWLGFLAVVFSILVFSNVTEASAAEVSKEVQFDLSKNEPQVVTYIDEKGQEITISIEPVQKNSGGKESGGISIQDSSHLLPYGTTSYKVSASSGLMGMSFYVDVYVPQSNISGSKFLKAYDKSFYVIGGTLTDEELTCGTKEAKYTANLSAMGGLGGAKPWVKATLSGNLITTTAEL